MLSDNLSVVWIASPRARGGAVPSMSPCSPPPLWSFPFFLLNDGMKAVWSGQRRPKRCFLVQEPRRRDREGKEGDSAWVELWSGIPGRGV